MVFLNSRKNIAGVLIGISLLVLVMQSCISAPPPPPPLPEELKHIQIVNGWPITRELEENCKSIRMEKVSRTTDWWAVHNRAAELKSDVVQFVYECSYDCDVRFWACGDSLLPEGKKTAAKVYGDFIGNVSEVKGNEVTIAGKNISEKAAMGKVLAVETDKDMVFLEVTFPMMTVAKCRVIKGSAKDVKTGMKVYNKPKKK